MIYKLTTSKITVENREYITYGVEGESVKFDDVSLDKNRVEEMISRMNRERLDECHFMDFINDELIR